MVSFFASTCPIQSGVGAIDNPDQSGQVFEQYDVSEVPEKFSRTTFRRLVVRKCSFFGHFKACINNFTDYNLYQRKLNVLTRKKYALYFLIQPLDFSLEIRHHMQLQPILNKPQLNIILHTHKIIQRC